MSVVVTIAAGVVVMWCAVSIPVAIAIGRACRIADDMSRRVLAAAQDQDRRPLDAGQALYVPADWADAL